MAKRDIQAAVTKTAAFTGADVDIADITGDFTVHLNINRLSGEDAVAVFNLVDSSDNFVASTVRAAHAVKGVINGDGKQGGQKTSWRKRDLKGIPAGTVGGELRLNLAQLSGTAPSCDYEAWVDYHN